MNKRARVAEKVYRVITSCRTLEQLAVAKKLFSQFQAVFDPGFYDGEYGDFLRITWALEVVLANQEVTLRKGRKPKP